jgi:LuxR family maltose regulon positive regulatory protein
MVRQGELVTLLGWLDALPDETARSWPWLCVASAWVLAYTGQLDDVEQHLQDAEEALAHLKGDADFLHVAGHIAALRAYAVVLKGDQVQAADLAREALTLLPEDERTTRGLIATILSSALRWSGDLDAARQACQEAIVICQEAGEINILIDALCDLASLQRIQGALHRSAETCREALALAEEAAAASGGRLPAQGQAAIRLSALLREWNELEEAHRIAREGIALCRQRGQDDELMRATIELARILQARGQREEAYAAIDSAQEIAKRLPAWHADHAAAWEARLQLMEGDVAAATRWANEGPVTLAAPVNFQNGAMLLTLAQVAIAEGGEEPGRSLEDALALLGRFEVIAEAAGATGYVIEILTLRALALEAKGEPEQARATLERTLALAAPEGYVRIFIDHGTRIEPILHRAIGRQSDDDTASQLLAVLEGEIEDEAPSAAPSAMPPMLEPLSERELEVLQLLTSSLSSAGMAEELFISVNTVRSHLQSIYRKLEVHSRYEAVARAQDLGLL